MIATKDNIFSNWEDLTYIGRTSLRSGLLKDLDSAIKKYQSAKTNANLQVIKDKYYTWILCKDRKYDPDKVGDNGKIGWKGSVRNKESSGYPVEVLHAKLFSVDVQKESKDFENILLRESRKDTVKILYGSKVETFKDFWLGKIKKAAKNKIKEEAEKLAQEAKQKLETEKNKLVSSGKVMVSDLVDEGKMQFVELGMKNNVPFSSTSSSSSSSSQSSSSSSSSGSSNFKSSHAYKIIEAVRQYLYEQLKATTQFISEAWGFIKEEIKTLINGILVAVLPLIGTVKSIYNAVEGILKGLKSVATLLYQKYKFNQSLCKLSGQHQLSEMILTLSKSKFKDDLKRVALELGQALYNALSGVFATIPGFEQAKGIITAIGKVLVKIYKIWQDYRLRKLLQKQINSVNPYMPQLPEFLQKEPCIAAYVISRSTDSTLLAMIDAGVDIHTWMRAAKENMPKVKKLKKMATEYLESYNIEIEAADDTLGNDRSFQEEIESFDRLKKAKTKEYN